MTVVVVLDALAAPSDDALRGAIGPERHERLRALLRERTLAWARAVTGGAPPLEVAVGEGLADRLSGESGPFLLVAPDVPGLSPGHAEGALDDLEAGVLLTAALSGDGSPFLVGLARADPDLLAAVGDSFDGLAATAIRLGGEVGMLRPERRLTTPADVRALLADPTAPPELRELLAPPA